MSDAVIADDPRYKKMFDVRLEGLNSGHLIEADMNGKFGSLRESAPVHPGYLRDLMGLPDTHHNRYATPKQGYSVFSFDACNAAFRDNEVFSSKLYKEMASVQATFGGSILEMGGAEHRRNRATLQPLFLKPKALTWWRERWIDDIVKTLIESLRREERADLNQQFCARLPMQVVTQGIGMDGQDALTFREALMTLMGANRGTPQEKLGASQIIETLLGDLIARRRAEPGQDVVSGLVATELELEDGSTRPLTDHEIMANCKLIILAGGGTTWRQLGITLWALLSHPDQLAAVKADRKLVEPAIEESLRWNPTDPYFSRVSTADTVLDGVAIPANSVVDICLGAGNRDPRRWTNPDAYDVHRPAIGHLGFSIGPHQCLGMNVSKAEMMVAINALFDHFPNVRRDPDAPEPALMGHLEGRGMTAVPVLLT